MEPENESTAEDRQLRCVNTACRSENVVLKGEAVAHATEGAQSRTPYYQCQDCGTVWTDSEAEWWAGYGG